MKIDIRDLILKKSEIVEYYENRLFIENGSTENLNFFYKLIDRYLFHTIEEISEFDVAITTDCLSQNEVIEEAIDIMSYLISTLYIVEKNIYGLTSASTMDFKEYISRTPFYDLEKDSSEFKLSNDGYYKNSFNILNSIITIRRLFPERKWHKITDRVLDKNELIDLFLICRKHLLNAIADVIFNIEWYIKENCSVEYFNDKKINEMIYQKHEKMMKSRISI